MGFVLGFDTVFIWLLIVFTPLFMGGGAFLVGVLSTQFMVKRAEHANKVIAALGYKNPEEVDLLQNERDINEKLTNEGRFVDYPFDVIRYGEPPSSAS